MHAFTEGFSTFPQKSYFKKNLNSNDGNSISGLITKIGAYLQNLSLAVGFSF